MALAAVSQYLRELHSLLPQEHRHSDAAAVLQDLKRVVLNEIPIEEQGAMASLLFDDEVSLVQFLAQTSIGNAAKSLMDARKDGLDLIVEVIEVLGKNLDVKHATLLKDLCKGIFQRDDAAKVQAATFKPISKIVRIQNTAIDANVLDVNTLLETYLKTFRIAKVSQTVKGWILKMAGILLERFPEQTFGRVGEIFSLTLDSLENQLKKKAPEQKLIAGAIKGLTCLLRKFAKDVVTPVILKRLYANVVLAGLHPSSGDELHFFEIPKAAMKFISNHGELLSQYLTEKAVETYNQLKFFCVHINKYVRFAAFPALEKFYSVVSAEIISGKRNPENDRETFTYFIREFWTGLEEQNAGIHKVSVYIRGFGAFAKSTHKYLGDDEVKRMVVKLFAFSERYYAGDSILNIEDTIAHLPSFIDSFAAVLAELSTLELIHMENLERIFGTLFLVFPQLFPYQKEACFVVVRKMFLTLFQKGTALRDLISRIALQGLTLTCSASTKAIPSNNQDKNYVEYLELWRNILNPFKYNKSKVVLPKPDQIEMRSQIYNEFMTALIQMLHKLTLNYTAVAATGAASNPSSDPRNVSPPSTESEIKRESKEVKAIAPAPEAVQDAAAVDALGELEKTLVPEVPKDFELFLNLVEFCKLVLAPPLQQTKKHKPRLSFFTNWIYIFGREIVGKSNQWPLVSGFYKLAGLALKIADSVGFFDGVDTKTDPSTSMQTQEAETKASAFRLFQKYLSDVVVRMKQYKDELLVSCLELVLVTPKEFIDIELFLPSLQIAFKIGLSHFEIASLAIDAIDYWRKTKLQDTLAHLSQILPLMNEYLITRIESRAGEFHDDDSDEAREENLKQLVQDKIVKLLAKFGGHNALLIPSVALSDSSSTEVSIAWDSVPRVKFNLPYHSGKVSKVPVYLDKLLPRLVQVAEGSADRQTKVAACELLHSVLLYMIGTNSHLQTPIDFVKLYERLFPVALRLAVDPELITRQLFEPLIMQMIHWFTKNKSYESAETMTLLDTLIQGVGDTSNGTLRDFSAKCLAEFLQWSVKQTSATTQAKHPFNAKSLLKRLYSLAKHPNPYKRLGFAITMKRLYRVLREEKSLVDQFIFEIMDNLIVALRLAEADAEGIGSVPIIEQVCSSLSKVIVFYKDLLNHRSKNRRAYIDLDSFVTSLFGQISRPELSVRTTTFALFLELSPLTSAASAKSWVDAFLGSDKKDIGKLCHSVEKLDDFANRFPSHQIIDVEEVRKWFLPLSAAVDAYLWLVSNDLVDVKALLSSKSTNLLAHFRHFFDTFALVGRKKPQVSSLVPSDASAYQSLRSDFIIRSVKFLAVVFDKLQPSVAKPLLAPINMSRLLEVLFKLILRPQSLGVVWVSSGDKKRVTPLILKLVKALGKVVPAKEVLAILEKILAKPKSNLGAVNFSKGAFPIESIVNIANGYAQLASCDLLEPAWKKCGFSGTVVQGCREIVEKIMDHSPKYDPVELQATSKLLHALFTISFDKTAPLALIQNDSPLQVSQADAMDIDQVLTERKLTKGEMFYQNYAELIDTHAANNFDGLANLIVPKLPQSPVLFRLFISVVDRQVKKASVQVGLILPALLNHASSLKSWFEANAPEEQRRNALDFVAAVLRLNPAKVLQNPVGRSLVVEMLLSFLSRSPKLTPAFKNDVLDVLPTFLLFVKDAAEIQKVVRRIADIVTYEFPVTSKDLGKDTTSYNEYIASLDKLLYALAKSKSLPLLEALYPILKEHDHVHRAAILNSFDSMLKSSSEEESCQRFDFVFKAFLDDSLPISLRMTLLRSLLLPIIYSTSISTARDLFARNVKEIMKPIDGCLRGQEYKATADLSETEMVNRIGAFSLVQALYETASSTDIRDVVNKRYCETTGKGEGKGNEINSAIMTVGHAIRREDTQYPRIAAGTVLDYHCSAFNATAAVLVCTQSKETFFNVFCFKTDLAKNERLWENIIDCNAKFEFEAETNFPVANRALASLITRDEPASGSPVKKADRRYISSVYLADSSFSQEVGNSTFFGVRRDEVAASYVEAGMDKTEDLKDENKTEKIVVPRPKKLSVAAPADHDPANAIELDPLNSNPCMLMLIKVIETLQKKFGSTYTPAQLPKWMQELEAKFKDQRTPINVKLFITKLIINLPDIFAPYARTWFRMIVNLVVESKFGDTVFNYFVRDVCILFLKWQGFVPREDADVASVFLHFLMKSAIYPSSLILRSNVQIIKLLIEQWKDSVAVSKGAIVNYLSQEGKPKWVQLCRATGIQLLGLLLANGVLLYESRVDKDFSLGKITDQLALCLKDVKKVYMPAAEVIGLALKNINAIQVQKVRDGFDYFEMSVRSKVREMVTKEDHLRALLVIDGISKHFPQFADSYFLNMFAQFKRYVGEVQVIALQIIRRRAPEIQDLWKQLYPFLDALLRHRDPESQELTLEICKEIISTLTAQEQRNLLNLALPVFSQHPNLRCREVFYELLIRMFNIEATRDDMETDVTDTIRKDLREALIVGLADKSPVIQKKLLEFWDHESRLSIDPQQRLRTLLASMASVDCESSFLSYATNFLLSLTSKSPDSEEALFEPLENAVYKEYYIDAGWTAKASAMTPMFSSQSFSMEWESTDNAVDDDNPFGIRATQDQVFSQTGTGAVSQVAPVRNTLVASETFAGLSMQSFPSDPNAMVYIPAPSTTTTSEGFKVPGKPMARPSSSTQSADKKQSLEEAMSIRIQRRFQKTPQHFHSQEFFHKQRALRLQKQKEAVQKDRQLKRIHQVQLLRQYRQGDLPDVTIKPSEIINPLKELANRDTALGRIVFTELAAAIGVTSDLIVTISNLLTGSKKNDPAFINALLRLAMEVKDKALPPAAVAHAALKSNNYHLGIMLLERNILDMNDRDRENQNKPVFTKTLEEHWHRLGVLYRALGEDDVFTGIFEHNAKVEETKEALRIESSGDYSQALKIYDQALKKLDNGAYNPVPGPRETSLWDRNRLECMMKMGSWRKLLENATKEIGGDKNLLFAEDYADPYLGYYIRASLHDDKFDALLSFLNQTRDLHQGILTDKFSSEMARIYAFKDDIGLSRYYASLCYRNFIQAWSTLPEVAFSARHKALQGLQVPFEIEQFANLIANLSNFESVDALRALVEDWKFRYPSQDVDDVTVWDAVVHTRSNLLRRIGEAYQAHWDRKPTLKAEEKTLKSKTLKLVERLVLESRANALEKIISAMRKQGNYGIISALVSKRNDITDVGTKRDLLLIISKSMRAQAVKNYTLPGATNRLLKGLPLFKAVEDEETDPDPRVAAIVSLKTVLLNAAFLQSLTDNALLQPKVVYQEIVNAGTAVDLESINSPTSPSNVFVKISLAAISKYEEAVDLAQENLKRFPDDAKVLKSATSAFIKFAQFTDILVLSEKFEGNPEHLRTMQGHVVRWTLQAMIRGSASARDKFPRVLQLISDPEIGRSFQELIGEVPSWMTLGWINQMMAVLRNPEGEYLEPLLIDIAKNYPQAMYYPLSISYREVFEKEDGATVAQEDRRADLLRSYLKVDLLEKFISALFKLTHPQHRFKDWADEMKPKLPREGTKEPITSRNRDWVLKSFKTFVAENFDSKQSGIGSRNKEFADTHREAFFKAFGQDGSKLLKMDQKAFGGNQETLAKAHQTDAYFSKYSGKHPLTEWSKWLSDFKESDYPEGDGIEIPGQYTGESRPVPHKHIKISSFGEQVLVMSSIRKPKRLILRGSDERDYMFLVKGGEDLRLDQRIQQLFVAMNRAFKRDAHAAKRGITIRTYSVVPMTDRVGILEWIDKTRPLKGIIEDELLKMKIKDIKEDNIVFQIKAAKLHGELLEKYDKTNAMTTKYYSMYQKASAREVTDMVNAQQRSVPPDLLRTGILALCSGPEAFLLIRSQFAKSIASISISGYILGIGDRHLDNFLIDLQTGTLIPIDFGHAFGSALQVLPVPELIPFRLTYQMRSFLRPLELDGLVQQCMLHALSAIRAERQTILSVMDVFVKEPLLDWFKYARRVASIQNEKESDAAKWFPLSKVEIAARKLAGDSPVAIMLTEIEKSIHAGKPYERKLQEFVRGDNVEAKYREVRSRIGERCRDDAEQVACLIEIATDPNILGRTYSGWAPWI